MCVCYLVVVYLGAIYIEQEQHQFAVCPFREERGLLVVVSVGGQVWQDSSIKANSTTGKCESIEL